MTFTLTQALHDGAIQFMHQDSAGVKLCVYQNQHYRWLQIGDIVQTIMDLSQPHKPLLPYLHPLLLTLYLRPDIRHITELGLGGGALQRYFSASDHTLVSIELNNTIIECFESYFAPTNPSKVIHTDAQLYLQQPESTDWLIVDLFDHGGSHQHITQPSFLQACKDALNDDGVLTLNWLPAHPLETEYLLDQLQQLFGTKPRLFSVPGYRNKVISVSERALPRLTYQSGLCDFASAHQLDLKVFQVLS